MNRYTQVYQRQTIIIIVLAVLPLFVVGGINYVLDPLQLYRKQQWTKPLFWTEQRYQNAGLIKNYLKDGRYDSIILGNSVADNFIPSHVEQILGWDKAIKLTVDGGYASEQAFMLENALSIGKIKNVLWVVRVDNFTPNLREQWHRIQKIPFHLYNNTIFDDGPYIFSMDIFNTSISLINGSMDLNQWSTDLDTLNYWQSRKHILKQINYNQPENLSLLASQIKKNHIENLKLTPNENYPLAELIFNFVLKNPHINFHIVISPETFCSLKSKSLGKISDYYYFQRFLVIEAEKYHNLYIFGFENDEIIVGNLANFRDPIHYHSGVNNFMLRKIALGQNRLNMENIDDYIDSVGNKLRSYEIYSSFSTMIPFAKDEENAMFHFATILSEAKTKLQENDYKGAIKLMDEVVQSPLSDSSSREQAYAIRATSNYRFGNLDAALADYNAAVGLHVQTASIYVDRGLILQKKNDYLGAEADFMKAISLAPDYYRPYWFLGNLRAKKGMYQEGISLLTKAIELNPARPDLYYARGKIFNRINEKILAQKDFQKMASFKKAKL